MREWQVDVEPELFQCSEGITVSGVGDSELYMVGTVARTVGRESPASARRQYTQCKTGFRGLTSSTLMTVNSIRWWSRMGEMSRSNGRRGH